MTALKDGTKVVLVKPHKSMGYFYGEADVGDTGVVEFSYDFPLRYHVKWDKTGRTSSVDPECLQEVNVSKFKSGDRVIRTSDIHSAGINHYGDSECKKGSIGTVISKDTRAGKDVVRVEWDKAEGTNTWSKTSTINVDNLALLKEATVTGISVGDTVKVTSFSSSHYGETGHVFDTYVPRDVYDGPRGFKVRFDNGDVRQYLPARLTKVESGQFKRVTSFDVNTSAAKILGKYINKVGAYKKVASVLHTEKGAALVGDDGSTIYTVTGTSGEVAVFELDNKTYLKDSDIGLGLIGKKIANSVRSFTVERFSVRSTYVTFYGGFAEITYRVGDNDTVYFVEA